MAGVEKKVHQHIGAAVKRIRKMQGRKISEIARAIGVNGSALSKVEKGEANLSIPSLYRIAEFLNVNASDLLDPNAVIDPNVVIRRFPVFGEIGCPVPASASAPLPQISLPFFSENKEAAAFKTCGGYVIGEPISADPAVLREGDRIVFVQRNVGAASSLHIGHYGRFSGAGDLEERTLLKLDTRLSYLASIEYDDPSLFMKAIAGMEDSSPEYLETPDCGWIHDGGAEPLLPSASQLIALRWLVVAEFNEVRRGPTYAEIEEAKERPNRLLRACAGA